MNAESAECDAKFAEGGRSPGAPGSEPTFGGGLALRADIPDFNAKAAKIAKRWGRERGGDVCGLGAAGRLPAGVVRYVERTGRSTVACSSSRQEPSLESAVEHTAFCTRCRAERKFVLAKGDVLMETGIAAALSFGLAIPWVLARYKHNMYCKCGQSLAANLDDLESEASAESRARLLVHDESVQSIRRGTVVKYANGEAGYGVVVRVWKNSVDVEPIDGSGSERIPRWQIKERLGLRFMAGQRVKALHRGKAYDAVITHVTESGKFGIVYTVDLCYDEIDAHRICESVRRRTDPSSHLAIGDYAKFTYREKEHGGLVVAVNDEEVTVFCPDNRQLWDMPKDQVHRSDEDELDWLEF